MRYETFDIDLRDGKIREGELGRILLESGDKVEHKRDYKTIRTGNLAVEYETKRNGETILSGIATTTAFWWAHEYLEDHRILLPVESLKILARLAIREGRHVWGGDNNEAHMALIPFPWLLWPPEQP